MSSRTATPGKAQFLCLSCGAIREVSERYKGGCWLVCHGECGRKVQHERVGWGDGDYREESNRQGDTALRDLQRDLDFTRGLGIEVRFCGLALERPEYNGVEATRFVDDGHIRVSIEDTYDTADRHKALRWAWRYLLPSFDSWQGAQVFGTGRDAQYGIHRL